MNFSEENFKTELKKKYFKRSELSDLEFVEWIEKVFLELAQDEHLQNRMGLTEYTVEILESIYSEWDLYLINEYPKSYNVIDFSKVEFPRAYYADWYRNSIQEGLGAVTGLKLAFKDELESRLLSDLANYVHLSDLLHFDWSESCGEGHVDKVKGQLMENMSNISLVDYDGILRYNGWMNFVFEPNQKYFFQVYWDIIDGKDVKKSKFGIPKHVWKKIPLEIKHKYRKQKVD